jgi:hypothetical protein
MIDFGPNKCTTIPEGGGVGVWRACAPATPAAVANTAANILNFNLFLQRLICPARPDHRAGNAIRQAHPENSRNAWNFAMTES